MIYTAAHGVGKGFLWQFERWLLALPAAMAIIAIVTLLWALPSPIPPSGNDNQQNSPTGTADNDPGTPSITNTSKNSSTNTPTSNRPFAANGSTVNRTSDDDSTTSANESRIASAYSTDTQASRQTIGGKGGGESFAGGSPSSDTSADTESTTASDTDTTSTQTSESGLPLSVCLDTKDTSILLLNISLNTDPICKD